MSDELRSEIERASTLATAAAEVRVHCGGGMWGEHPDYPVSDWGAECAANDTRLGYWEWLVCRLEEAEMDGELAKA